ncbi:glycoside hydrolase family 15 protein [Auraticoccus monumenti]|uniref:Glucoamylase (Glucan-1,4-alpha-glucosidase), GH15 family n=1 Tax=Auraticoccus monumenti TaxID=675864 RepID=A0A1G7BKK0_9ACTN|nr:glycoside hydrolase family 15 protein [Auraticoccus monumenti]SDE27477.1 Glucoamylase (glucan-1,4-alpha-glucosidase), GH15 family [Auraticoccus monumenti]
MTTTRATSSHPGDWFPPLDTTASVRVGSCPLHWQQDEPVEAPVDERDADGYLDLRSYASIGDGRTIALVGRDGRIDWLPLPNLDSPAPFGALLDETDGGYLALRPVEDFTVSRRYLTDTNVLQTTFRTASGLVQVTDAMNTGVAGRLPWGELARRIEGVEGAVEMRAEVRPGTCLNRASAWIHDTVQGRVLRVNGLTMAVRTLQEESVAVEDRAVVVRYRTSPGSRHLLGLVATEGEPLSLPLPEDVDARVDRTIAGWRDWSGAVAWEGRWQPLVRRSALLLKQLIHAPTGAVAAAATTSLPESLTRRKNWDYRYSWTRDSAYTLTALLRFGVREETHAAISWMLRTLRSHGGEPMVLSRLDGTHPGTTVEEHDVPGWRGTGGVVTGNPAADQLQLGVFGDVFSIVTLYVEQGNVLDDATSRLMTQLADQACDVWRLPDAGMWELPVSRHHITSKLGCWHALTQAVRLAEAGQVPGDAERWRSEAERVRAWVEEHGWDEELGAYVWYPGSKELDASILLHAISGFDRGERMSSTLDVLRRELADGEHLYRYTGAADEEGAFVACSYWMVSALTLVGRVDEAVELMDCLDRAPNDVGLLAEMIDPRTQGFLGNLPQALSHLALVNAAITLNDSLEQD